MDINELTPGEQVWWDNEVSKNPKLKGILGYISWNQDDLDKDMTTCTLIVR